MMTSPKMYWTDEPMSGQYFLNTEQDGLFQNSDNLGEVVFWDKRKRKTVLVGKTFEEAIVNIS